MTATSPTTQNPSRPEPQTTKEAAMHLPTTTPNGTSPAPRRRPSLAGRRLATLGVVATAGLAFAACGGSSGASTATSAPASPSDSGSSTTPSTLPGASGTIAAVNGSSLEVQNAQSGQTTVNYTSTTTIRQISSTSASAVTVGSCVSAFGKPTSSAKTSSPFGEPITATTVSISQPVSGACERGGFGGRPGGFGGASGGTAPGGTRPSGGSFRPPSGRTFGNGSFGAASGQVTAVSGSQVTVDETNPQTKTSSSVTVTLTSSTTFTTTQTGTAAAIVVGQCARATGAADSTGAITAQELTISAPTNGSCTTGFGFRGGFGGGAAGPGSAPGA